MSAPASTRPGEITEANKQFYNGLWSRARLVRPEKFNTWPMVSALSGKAGRCLEVGPGLRPRLPLDQTEFLDISADAVAALRASGASATLGNFDQLPFEDASFGLVAALDIIEHVEDHDRALDELARVTRPGATLIISAPLHPDRWISFDATCGHCRRYEPDDLLGRLRRRGFAVEQSASYGMQPKSEALVNFGMFFFNLRKNEAMWWYNHVFMPIGLHFQPKLELTPGLPDLQALDQVLLVCRKEV